MVFTASLLGAQHKRDCVENKPASLLVVVLARHLTGCLHLFVADRWKGQAVHSLWWPSLSEDSQTEHGLLRIAFTSSCIMLSTIVQTTTTFRFYWATPIHKNYVIFLEVKNAAFSAHPGLQTSYLPSSRY